MAALAVLRMGAGRAVVGAALRLLLLWGSMAAGSTVVVTAAFAGVAAGFFLIHGFVISYNQSNMVLLKGQH